MQNFIITLRFKKSQFTCFLADGWQGKHKADVEGEDDRGQRKHEVYQEYQVKERPHFLLCLD